VTVGRPSRFALLREHNTARRIARRLQKASAASAAEDRRALLAYWYGSGAAHLRAEEHVMLEAWNRHGGAAHPLNVSIRDELTRLSRDVRIVAADPLPPAPRLQAIGRALAAHLSRQERELYGVVEDSVARDELEQVDAVLQDLRNF
jgi:hypothetical protein